MSYKEAELFMRSEQPVRTLLLDNYDSYTFNLFQQLAVINGCQPVVVRNDEIIWDELARLDIDNIVISPGPGRPEIPRDFGLCREVLTRSELPTLGVCLGHQGIAAAYGGRIVAAPEVMHGRRSRIRHRGPLFRGMPQDFEAVRYHSLVVAEPLPGMLEPTARADDGSIMAVTVRGRPLYGVQFHPESILTEHGDILIANFRDLTLRWWSGRHRHSPARNRSRRHSAAPPATASVVGQPSPLRAFAEYIPGPFDPEAVFESIGGHNPAAWLDSAARGVGTGRFSYIAATGGALSEFVFYDAAKRIVRVEGVEGTGLHAMPLTDFLEQRLAARWLTERPDVPFAFLGGYVGWIGYECKSECGGATAHAADTEDAALLFADRIVVLDHDTGGAYVLALALGNAPGSSQIWVRETAAALDRLRGMPARSAPGAGLPVQAIPARGRLAYVADIKLCQDLLRRGETYEVCLTNEFRVPCDRPAYELYRRLRRLNPAPYGAYLDFGRTRVLSSSPECFVRITAAGLVQAKPIKGTVRRDPNQHVDQQLAKELANDEKERAENLMIVDLLRNDLGRVCQVGTVTVPSLMAIESFKTVHQMVSTVQGQLPEGTTVADCLRSMFPGGSMTGAPKIRTMEIIDKVEGRARGVYSGAIGYLSADGAAELSIVIRTLVYRDGWVTIGAGGAITILSDPELEWAESVLKANSVLRAIDAEFVEETDHS